MKNFPTGPARLITCRQNTSTTMGRLDGSKGCRPISTSLVARKGVSSCFLTNKEGELEAQ